MKPYSSLVSPPIRTRCVNQPTPTSNTRRHDNAWLRRLNRVDVTCYKHKMSTTTPAPRYIHPSPSFPLVSSQSAQYRPRIKLSSPVCPWILGQFNFGLWSASHQFASSSHQPLIFSRIAQSQTGLRLVSLHQSALSRFPRSISLRTT